MCAMQLHIFVFSFIKINSCYSVISSIHTGDRRNTSSLNTGYRRTETRDGSKYDLRGSRYTRLLPKSSKTSYR